MTISSNEAERLAHDILSSRDEILSVSVIDKSGDILAGDFRESFTKRFQVRNLKGSRYNGTLAVATLSIVNEVKDVFGEPQAIITIHKDCKLMLLPMLSYDLIIGFALERSADVHDDKFANEIESILARTSKEAYSD